ncbi:MAG: ATP-binding protein [Paeniclostridium sordellii]|nr:ATP-binding protein [Paeniclostridium sordellii]
MNKYVEEIVFEIEKQAKKGELSLIRIEGIDTPIIYKEVCEYLNKSNKYNLIAKLSIEKYDKFEDRKLPTWQYAIDYLKDNEYIDLDGSMTKIRNSSVDFLSNNKKTIILLMGTELVLDKGGLADFYCISPETILKKLKKDYSSWFRELFEDNDFKDEYRKGIHNIFKTLFKSVNIDLIKYSNLIEKLETKTYHSEQELCEDIYYNLDLYWGIPSIKNIDKMPKLRSLKNGSKDCTIISKAVKFINRSDYKDFLSKSRLNTIESKIDKYVQKHEINENDKFPEDTPIFNNYGEFKDVLLEFINGKNLDTNKQKLLSIDFNIINEILNIKLDKNDGKVKEKNKTIQLSGEPIIVYSKMIINAISEYIVNHNGGYPSKVTISVDDITLNNCVNSDEKHNACIDICSFLGGIVEFLNKNKLYTNEDELINISYKDDIDIFDISNYEILDSSEFFQTINTTEKPSSKIKYIVEAENEEGYKSKIEFVWAFKSYDSWKNSFYILNKLTDDDKTPLFATCKDIQLYTNCESEDEFFINLEKINLDLMEDKLRDKIQDYLPQEIYENFILVLYNFKNFQEEVKNKGFYNTLDNTCTELITSYVNLLNQCKDMFDELTSIQRKYLYLVLNIFLITKDKEFGFDNEYTSETIIPPYHPIMLEKMKDRMNFVKDGYSESFEYMSTMDKINTKNIFEVIDKYSQLSNITSGIEVLQGKEGDLILTKKVYGFYGIYKDHSEMNSILSDNVFDHNDILEDEELNIKELLKISPQSNIIFKNVINYIMTFPYKIDGLNLLIVNPSDMQFVVSGIHSVVNRLGNSGLSININLKIILSDNRKNGADYLRYWLDNYFSDDSGVNINTYINYVDFNSKKIKDTIDSYANNEDIAFIYDIMAEKNITFIPDNLELDVVGNFKFPMVYIPQPIAKTQEKRSTVISQFQFDGAKSYTQLVNLIKYPNAIRGTYRVAKDIEITNNFKEIIDVVHENSNWIICVDEGMDRNFLSRSDRKIIGFSTGEGDFGELNITVSAHSDKVEDIKNKLKNRLKNKFSKWSSNSLDEAAKICIERCEKLDGSRLLESLNPNDYEIHSFLAYVLTLQDLELDKENDKYLVRSLINLDAHRHWFEGVLNYDSDTKSRPDLLLLEIENNDRNLDANTKLKISATVIECKMGFTNAEHIEKAKGQLSVGINTLANNWNPDNDSSTSRYWYNQLYRSLVFATLNISDNSTGYINFVNKLYSILEGNFDLELNGKIMAYWLNDQKDILEEEDIEIDNIYSLTNVNKTTLCTAGQLYIQKMLLNQENLNDEIDFYDLESEETIEEEIIEGVNDEEAIVDEVEAMKKINILDEPDSNKSIVEGVEKEVNNIEEKFNDELEQDTIDNIEESQHHEEKVLDIDDELKNQETNKQVDVKDVRVLLGEDIRTKEKMYWEFGNKQLNNRHLLISGNSGMGKTYCIQGLLYELAKQSISTVIFDYTDGFTEQKLDPIFTDALTGKIEEQYVKIDKFPINPFSRHEIQIGSRSMLETDVDIANRLSAVFKTVYKFGPQQKSVIYEAIKSGFKKYKDDMNFEYMVEEIKEVSGGTASTVLSKIMPFIDINPFDSDNTFSWGDIIDSKGKVYIIQLTGFDREIQLMLTDLILWDIWNYCVKYGNESRPLPIVLDEAQNLSHKSDSPSGKILTEGRKFGIAGIYATQFLKGALNDDEIQRLQQSGQKLYFGPPENSIMEIAKSIDINAQEAKEWAEKLKKLKKGECVTCGNMVKGDVLRKYDPKIIKVTSLGERVNE